MITYRFENNIYVVYIDGDITPEKARELIERAEYILNEKVFSGIVVNLEKTRFIGPSGIVLIIQLLKKLKHHHVSMAVCNLNKQLKTLLKVTQLDVVLNVCEGEKAAMDYILRLQALDKRESSFFPFLRPIRFMIGKQLQKIGVIDVDYFSFEELERLNRLRITDPAKYMKEKMELAHRHGAEMLRNANKSIPRF